MPYGLSVPRHCVVLLADGRMAVDRGHSLFQDILTGEFLPGLEQDVSRLVRDDELEALRQVGIIAGFDAFQAYLFPLPERFEPPID